MRGRFAVWAAVVAVATGCASQWRVDTFAAPEGNVASRQTFAWKGGDVATSQYLEPEVLQSVEAQVRTAVVEELRRRGYSEVATPAEADLLVSYGVTGMRRFVAEDNTRIGAPSPNQVLRPGAIQPPPASSVPREIALREGTVTLFIDDVKLDKLVWRGEVAAEIRSGSAEHTGRTIAQMTREIARNVPARAPAASP